MKETAADPHLNMRVKYKPNSMSSDAVDSSTAVATTSGDVVEDAAAVTKMSEDAVEVMGVTTTA